MALPLSYDFESRRRVPEKANTVVSLTLTLAAGNRRLEVQTYVDNASKDHRLRLLVQTGICTDTSVADIPYDIVYHAAGDHPADTWSKVRPNSTFAALEKEDGLAVLTEGAHEYEHIEPSVLAFTLVRATGVISRDKDTFETGGDQWLAPENQCLRTIKGRFGILPYAGSSAFAGVPVESAQFRAGLSVYYTSSDQRRFMQGRTAVQDTRLAEYFFLPDPYESVKIPDNTSLLETKGGGMLITALKKSENDDKLILRAVNLTENKADMTINTSRRIHICALDERVGKHAKNGTITVKGKKIVTLAIE